MSKAPIQIERMQPAPKHLLRECVRWALVTAITFGACVVWTASGAITP